MNSNITPYREGEQPSLLKNKPVTNIEKALVISNSSHPGLGLSTAISSIIKNIKEEHRAQIYSLVNEIQEYANEAPWEKIFSVFQHRSHRLGVCYRDYVCDRFLSVKDKNLTLISDITTSSVKSIADTVHLTKFTDYDNQIAFIRYLNLDEEFFLFFNNFRKRRRIVYELKYILNTMKYLLSKYVVDNQYILDL